MKVEIYSDVVCPWCYIGKRRWERALAEFEHADEVEVVWRPHQLDPGAPRHASPAFDAYAKRFGGPERAGKIIEHMTGVAADVGLSFRFDIAQRANTFDAHRMLWLAEREGDQGAMKEALLQAYFVDGRDVSDHETLAALAPAGGLGEGRARAMLASEEGVDEVRAELVEGAELGITAVPTFVFEGPKAKFGVPGAQEPEVFLATLRRIYERERAGAGS